jgi:hypothetical protein
MDLVIPDVSEWQGRIDHRALVAGLRAVYGGAAIIVRINFGTVKVDLLADLNIDGLRAAGADVLGWYCYLLAKDDPIAAAVIFCRVLQAHGGLRAGEFVVCDDEEGTGDQSGRVDAFLAACDSILRVPDPSGQDWWYSDLNFAAIHNLAAARGRRWIAAYGQGEPTVPHDLWQFTDAQQFAGISGPCDASVFHGSISDLRSLIGGLDMATLDEMLARVQAIQAEVGYMTDPTDPDYQNLRKGGVAWLLLNGQGAWQLGISAQVAALLSAEGASKAAIDALAANVAAASQLTAVKSELDQVQAAIAAASGGLLPAPIDLTKVYAELGTLGKHLGVDVATGAVPGVLP